MIKYLIAILVLMSTALDASTHVVRAGDHQSFVRLVVQSSINTEFNINPLGNTLSIESKNTEDTFDVGRVFDRIDNQIVTDARVTGNTAQFDLTCKCEIEISYMEPRLTIIDIIRATVRKQPLMTGPDVESENLQSYWDQSLNAVVGIGEVMSPAPLPIRDVSDEQKPITKSANRKLKSMEVIEADITLHPSTRSTFLFDPGRGFDNQVGAEIGVFSNQAETFAEALTKQIGRAATQGILEPSRDFREISESQEQIQNLRNTPSAQNSENTRTDRQSSHIAVRNPISEHNFGRPQEEFVNITCQDSGLFDVSTWATENFSDAISTIRQSLFTEFDRLDSEVAHNLIETYLYFGFTDEARQLLPLIEGANRNTYAYSMVLESISNETNNSTSSELANCNSNVSLWATILNTDSSTPVNTDQALLALNALPPHLRQIVAPKLSKALRERGLLQEAAQALRSTRKSHDLHAEQRLEEVEVSTQHGGTKEATSTLLEVSTANVTESPRALVKYLKVRNAEGNSTSEKILTLAKAYGTELRGTPIAEELERERINALIVASKYGDAIAAISRASFGKDFQMDRFETLVAAISQVESDTEFLSVFSLLLNEVSFQAPPQAIVNAANRAYQAGFPSTARSILDTNISVREHPDLSTLYEEIVASIAVDKVVSNEPSNFAEGSPIVDPQAKPIGLANGTLIASEDEVDPAGDKNLPNNEAREPNSSLVSLGQIADETSALGDEIERLLTAPEVSFN